MTRGFHEIQPFTIAETQRGELGRCLPGTPEQQSLGGPPGGRIPLDIVQRSRIMTGGSNNAAMSKEKRSGVLGV